MSVNKMYEAQKEKRPRVGFSLVGIDSQEIPGSGDELYTVGQFETLAEAEARKKELEGATDYNGDTLLIYGPE